MPDEAEAAAIVSELMDRLNQRLELRFSDDAEEAEFKRRFRVSESGWNEFIEFQRRHDLEQNLQGWPDRFGVRFAEEVAEKFIDAHFRGANAAEKALIREQISRESKAPDFDRHGLVDMVKDGLPGVRRHRRKRHLKHLRHTWAAVKGLIGIAVVVGIYDKLHTDFEVIVCSLLILSYTLAIRGLWKVLLAAEASNHAGYVRYADLKQTMGMTLTADEHSANWRLEDQLKKQMVGFTVSDGMNSIVNLIVFWHLFKLFS